MDAAAAPTFTACDVVHYSIFLRIEFNKMNPSREEANDRDERTNPEVWDQCRNNIEKNIPFPLKKGNRETIQDYYIENQKKLVSDNLLDFKYKIYIRFNATKIKFTKISFAHCIFDNCTLKECVFDNCDFTGSKFSNTNLNHSKFIDCTLDYVTFDKCLVDDEILSDSPPKKTNLKLRFSRSLRVNYQSIGDARSANKAIHVELNTTAEHLKDSWRSEDEYFRKKYPGLKRLAQFFKWIEFWVLHFLWGNGESIGKLFRTIIIINLIICIYHANTSNGSPTIENYISSLKLSPAIFLGLTDYSDKISLASVLTTASRLISFALLTALLVKRFGRR